MPKKLPKTYNPKKTEDQIYKMWEDSGCFKPDFDNQKIKDDKLKNFSISMPPPNATGQLHIGHAMFLTLQDILTRWHRMQGKLTLWLPGTDHASIATQNKVEKILLKQEGKTRHDLGRCEFLKKVNQYVKNSQKIIRKQIRKMGASCDWSRERYTLDKGLTNAVEEIFVRMYNDGLIYRGDRIVNWCPRCESTLADDEVEHKERAGRLYYIKYKLKIKNPAKGRAGSQYIIVATARPETMLGDTAVAVNPKDKRYKHLIGKTVILPIINRELTIIADNYVDPEFGTGAVKVTPCHDPNDYQIAQRHNLKKIKIFNNDATLNDQVPKKYQRLTRFKARKLIVKELKKQNLLTKIEKYHHSINYCYRCDTIIEPITSKQWFVDVNKKTKIKNQKLKKIVGKSRVSLKERATAVVKKDKIKIIPKRFKKTYFHWMESLHDWCISRQIWFGHRIPVYYCQKCDKIIVKKDRPKKCPKCGSVKIKQDPDTLDTWFSSGLWTFSTLGWPKKTDDLKRFHPTSVMETGYDILFFWIARMIIMSTYALEEIPFEKIYLHGLVRDKQGRKMSKSLGNGIDPLEMIKKYGTDAVRLSLIIGTTPGNDVRLYKEKIASYRNFINKIWNIARFVITQKKQKKKPSDLLNVDTASLSLTMTKKKFSPADKWILYELNQLIKKVDRHLKQFKFSLAGEEIYEFIWHKLADWYIEITKKEHLEHQSALLQYILKKCLILLHPFVPFVSEYIWGIMNRGKDAIHCASANKMLITQQWVEGIDFKISKADAKKFKKIQQKIIKKRKNKQKKKQNKKTALSKKEKQELKKYIADLEKRLKNKKFLQNAPKKVIQKEKARLKKARTKLTK